MNIPKIFITLGIVLIIIGILWQIGGRFLPLGKLPGDILIKRENATFYFPIMTSIIISIVLSLILFLLGRFR
ncbi:DUF2905 domain-containing protein [Halalkalibacterium halodurans]|jgi:Zn-dependent protease with chaperone function|uniref:BH1226 protein n=1 Tax=Halalkalibacterium halodurans (strain ATCC BAA-125 / DSM 18197 / FERM 7344 / JCM 9153 / C-125) TaxID=272558 RepID=Q9KDI7_HALH5|nr:DUF2905 domain-containing protein [Halalkalibacterium halodurans]MDY7221749.1 DUF2905 domain-containing protein [Halalkalibacterium halodurans]MDY7241025.1 DUF2905 domain-containing protein [Halalkalibacterium halodurans]MED3645562.1 DUF2905 domain-containing protein [Halalkalibacterium halodurans]MED4079423.1 DUF2905 domain-containing protein [Halalkalibacterium halodurans]MED4086555.1 DUF2905 domain-containing protein [Halalkalibacterium halodurans]